MTPQELKTARGRRTQVEMAQLMGVSLPAIRNWEQGVSPVPEYVPMILAGIAPKPVPGWRVVVLDLRMSAGAQVATLPTHERARAYVEAQYPSAKIIADSQSTTLYAVIVAVPELQFKIA